MTSVFEIGNLALLFHGLGGMQPVSYRPSTYFSFILAPNTISSLDDRISIGIEDIRVVVNKSSFDLIQQTDLGSLLYRSGRSFMIKHFSENDNSRIPDWITVYDTVSCEAHSYTTPNQFADGTITFPTIGHYPHIQFLLTAYLATHAGSLHHCACAIHNGKAYLFAGRSGVGKSTMSRLLDASGSFQVIGDDRTVVRRDGNTFTAYGTPWPSSAGFAENAHAPLGGIFFLHQSKTNRVEPISSGTAFKQLLPVSDIPWYDQPLMDGILKYCEQLAESVPVWDVHFRPDQDIVSDLLNRMD